MSEEEQIEFLEPPKGRGWPKGKLRGPRKPAPEKSYEPVDAMAVLLSGKTVELKASSFDVANGRYTFVSFPEQRGFKTVTILKADQVAMLEITAPDEMCERLKEQRPSPPSITASAYAPVVSGEAAPIQQYNPFAQAVRDSKATQAAKIPNPAGIPMSEISRNEDGKQEIVGATLMP